MHATSKVFFLNFAKKTLEDSSGSNPLRWVHLPAELDAALSLAAREWNDHSGACVFFSEHWSEGRTTSQFSTLIFREALAQKLMAAHTLEREPHFRFAVPFNLLEPGAAREDHDHYRTLSEIYRDREQNGRAPFSLFLFRPTSAITRWHLFELRDFPNADAAPVVERIQKLGMELSSAETSPAFPEIAPRWAQTYFRRKQEILSIEHWTNFFRNRIVRDLEEHRSELPDGYSENWEALNVALTELYSIEAAERNHQLKETMFNHAPEAHHSPDFETVIVRTARAFFPDAHFILEDRARLSRFEKALDLAPFSLETATALLDGAEEYLEGYPDYLERSRPQGRKTPNS